MTTRTTRTTRLLATLLAVAALMVTGLVGASASVGAQTGGSGNRPFNDVWLALAPVFGVTMNSLGAASQYTGPLPGIVS